MQTIEEYKLFSEATQKLSERRQAATQTYLTVNTAIFGVLAFLVKDAGFRGWGLVAVSVPLYLVGILACLIWIRIITEFKRIIGWRYEQLRSMEEKMPDSHQIYTQEWDRLFKPQPGKKEFAFSNLEAWLPRLFVALYAAYAVISLAVAAGVKW